MRRHTLRTQAIPEWLATVEDTQGMVVYKLHSLRLGH